MDGEALNSEPSAVNSFRQRLIARATLPHAVYDGRPLAAAADYVVEILKPLEVKDKNTLAALAKEMQKNIELRMSGCKPFILTPHTQPSDIAFEVDG